MSDLVDFKLLWQKLTSSDKDVAQAAKHEALVNIGVIEDTPTEPESEGEV